jgi:hypothetical protein
MLSEEDKQRIREEEIFRDEVRRTLAKGSSSSKMAFLNSPFGIYLLSTVLIGLVSFAYTRWKEQYDASLAHREQIEKLQGEINFRVRQLDAALANANQQITFAETSPEPDPDKLSQAKTTLLIGMDAVSAAIRFGGLGKMPGDYASDTWVRFRDLELQPSVMPFNRGYKFKDYAFETLSDLVIDVRRLRGLKSDAAQRTELEENLNALEDAAYNLTSFSTKASPESQTVGRRSTITSMHAVGAQYRALLKPITDGWARAKSCDRDSWATLILHSSTWLETDYAEAIALAMESRSVVS